MPEIQPEQQQPQAGAFPQDINTGTDFSNYRASKWVRDYNASEQGQNAPAYRSPYAGGQGGQGEPDTGYNPTGDWDYKDPPENAMGTPLDRRNQPLPTGAVGYKPNGEVYWGEGVTGWWNKTKGAFGYLKDKDDEGTVAFAAHQNLIERNEEKSDITKFWNVTLKGGVTGAIVKSLWAVPMLGFELAEELIQRPYGTVLGTIQDIGASSSLPQVPTISGRLLDKVPEGVWGRETFEALGLFMQKTPIRLGWQVARMITANVEQKIKLISGDFEGAQAMAPHVNGEPVSYFRVLKDNFVTSRMAWSLGVENQQLKAAMLDRVAEGENPDLVAMELDNDVAQFIGEVFFDASAFLSVVLKSARKGKQIIELSEDLLKPAQEAVEFISSKGDEAASVFKSAEHLDELGEVVGKTMDRVEGARELAAKQHGFRDPLGKAKRMKATQEAGIFGSWIAQNSNSADEAIDAFQQLARMASKNPDERMKAIRNLTGLMKDPSALFSDEAAKFSLLMRNLFLDADGILDYTKFADEFIDIQKSGDKSRVFDFIGGKMDNVMKKTFPLLKEAVEAGEDVPLIMKGINWLDNSALGTLKNKVSWFSGRAYIGTNPGVAVRGGLYDLMISVVDTDVGILKHGPGGWADVSKAWLGGMDHPALYKGLGSLGADIAGKKLAKKAGFRTFADMLDHIKEGKGLDKVLLSTAGVLEFLEKRSGAKILGKTMDDIMKKMLRSKGGLGNIDNLVEAGLDPKIAGRLVNRIIGNMGDTEKVKKLVLEEIGKGYLSLFSDGAWIPTDLRKLLNEFGLENGFMEQLQSGKPLDEVLEWLKKSQSDLVSKTDELANQHVQAVAENLKVGATAGEEALAVQNKVLYDLLEDGKLTQERARKVQDLLDEANDMWGGDKMAYDAWRNATHHVQGQLQIMAKTDPVIADALVKAGNEPWQAVGKTFGMNSAIAAGKSGDVSRIATSVLRGKPKDLPALIEEAKGILGVSYLPSDKKKAYDMIWDIWKRDQQPAMYRAGRIAAGQEFDDLQKILVQSGVPQEILDGIVTSSAKVDRARIWNEVAETFHNGIMIDGQIKNVGEYMASLFVSNQTEDLIRTISKYTSFHTLARPGTTKFDADILQDLSTRLGIKADSLGDLNPDEVYKAIQEWRVKSGLSAQVPQLTDLIKTPLDEMFKVVQKVTPEVSDMLDKVTTVTKLTEETAAKVRFLSPDGRWILAEADEGHATIAKQSWNIGDGKDFTLLHEPLNKHGIAQVSNTNTGMLVLGTDTLTPAQLEALQEVQKTLNKPRIQIAFGLDEPVNLAEVMAKVPESLIPAQLNELDNISEARHIFEMQKPLDDMFDELTQLTKDNFGKTVPMEDIDPKKLKAIDEYFDTATQKVSEARLVAMKGAEATRDFALHDYSQRYGFDAALSYLFNFHFWPSRTAHKWLTSRMLANPGLVSAYFDYREQMQNIHSGAPEWWKYAINTNEMLGLNMENPLYFRLENLIQPIYFMAGADFTNEAKRVNWWTGLMDGVGKVAPGYWNPLIQYGIATALAVKGEEEAAAAWAGRTLPATQIIKSITAIIGVKDGAGLELDPGVHLFSGGMEPFEVNRVATILAGYIKNKDFTEEQILEAALNHEGEAWDRAVADQSQQFGRGNLFSNFFGVNTRMRTPLDLEVERFWGDYTSFWAISNNMSAEEITYGLEKLRVQYPFMEPLLLGRKGGVERSEAYAWNVLARVSPGKTDDLAKAIGMPYDLIGKFYDDRGDTSDWSTSDRDLFFTYMIDLGASLALPDSATRLEWAGASFDYRKILSNGQDLFGEEIWDMLDQAYVELDQGINGSVSFQNFLEANPIVEQAMRWKEEQIMKNPLLQEYYVSHKKLRDYYKGEMYQKLEDEFGSNIWDTWSEYYSYVNTGQKEVAKKFKAAHPEMKQYSERKKEYETGISANMIKFGETIPDSRESQLREDFEPDTAIKALTKEYFGEPEQKAYRISEWVELIGQTETAIALQVYDGLLSISELPDDIRNYYSQIAQEFGLSLEELLINIGQADR